jgi:hypothetical protein
VTGDTVCASRGGGGGGGGAKGGKGGAAGAGAGGCGRFLSLPTSGIGKGGHLGYNADGQLVHAAACYIQQKYQGAGGHA